ncbi:hypothetical protein VIGAN_04071700 [Vigna angularis var. angularis]|uniref:Uncharacterized protein n=1 Tax=Vigna angularis var. angularis TaxID=157739 RepID=A0A0S3RSI2_PHAAN|nr:hypothetical protein VIGAN_04071700 [Vigna angularis var. angularis]
MVAKEAMKDDIFAIGNLAMRCLRLNGRKRPTMKEVSLELEALRKVQNSLQIKHDDEYPTTDIVEECTDERMPLCSEQDSTSF